MVVSFVINTLQGRFAKDAQPFCLSPPSHLTINSGSTTTTTTLNIFTICLLDPFKWPRAFPARDRHAQLVITQSALQLPTFEHTLEM